MIRALNWLLSGLLLMAMLSCRVGLLVPQAGDAETAAAGDHVYSASLEDFSLRGLFGAGGVLPKSPNTRRDRAEAVARLWSKNPDKTIWVIRLTLEQSGSFALESRESIREDPHTLTGRWWRVGEELIFAGDGSEMRGRLLGTRQIVLVEPRLPGLLGRAVRDGVVVSAVVD